MKTCENCSSLTDGSYGSGRFCSAKCARAFSTKNKRVEINKAVSLKLSGINSVTGMPANDDVEKICAHCSGRYTVKFNKRQSRFCSRDCRTKFHKLSADGVHPVVGYRQRIKLRAIEYKGGKCVECGYHKSMRSMQFHHLDPSKKDFGIGGKSLSWDKIKAELDKCILVCSNCHGEIHDGLLDVTKFLDM